jgi:pyridoxamine 5'-phosphate oxidase
MNHAEEIWKTLVRATVDKKHPWRVVGFGTAGQNGPQVRSVILRGANPEERQLMFYTDKRSQKICDIENDPRVALLFWNARNNTQLRVCGIAEQQASELIVNSLWLRIPDYARKDYATLSAPGSVLQTSVTGVALETARENFVVLNVKVECMEILRLDRAGHVRIAFALNDSNEWTEKELVP